MLREEPGAGGVGGGGTTGVGGRMTEKERERGRETNINFTRLGEKESKYK